MAAMVAVDIGAQSGRVALGRFDGDRLSVERGAPFPERAAGGRERVSWDAARSTRSCSWA